MDILISPSRSPETNLATEQKLLTERLHDVLFLYVNTPSVIIGRNQLAEAEADLDYCSRHGIPLLRRLSGGGAVYHDEGNINYAFAVNAAGSVLDRDFLVPVIDALAAFGVTATAGKRRELLVGGRKISGTAAHVVRGRQLFHGTLLFDTDLERMRRALNGDRSLRGKHVASVPSEVANLRELIAEPLSADEFLHRLAGEFRRLFTLLSDPTQ
jgi:lipoate-protein ligase A